MYLPDCNKSKSIYLSIVGAAVPWQESQPRSQTMMRTAQMRTAITRTAMLKTAITRTDMTRTTMMKTAIMRTDMTRTVQK